MSKFSRRPEKQRPFIEKPNQLIPALIAGRMIQRVAVVAR